MPDHSVGFRLRWIRRDRTTSDHRAPGRRRRCTRASRRRPCRVRRGCPSGGSGRRRDHPVQEGLRSRLAHLDRDAVCASRRATVSERGARMRGMLVAAPRPRPTCAHQDRPRHRGPAPHRTSRGHRGRLRWVAPAECLAHHAAHGGRRKRSPRVSQVALARHRRDRGLPRCPSAPRRSARRCPRRGCERGDDALRSRKRRAWRVVARRQGPRCQGRDDHGYSARSKDWSSRGRARDRARVSRAT